MTLPGFIAGLHLTCAVAMAVFCVLRRQLLTAAPSATRTEVYANRSLWTALAALAITEFLTAAPVGLTLEDATAPGLSVAAYISISMLAAWGVLNILICASGAPRAAGHTARLLRANTTALLTSLAVMSLPWIFDRPPARPAHLREFTDLYWTSWGSALFWCAHLAYLTSALTTAAVLCWNNARHERATVATGLRLIGGGCAVGLTYVAQRAAQAVSWLGGGPFWTARQDALLNLVPHSLALGMIVLGCTWAPLLDRLHTHRDKQQRQRLLTDAAQLRRLARLAHRQFAVSYRLPRPLNLTPLEDAQFEAQLVTADLTDGLVHLAQHSSPLARQVAASVLGTSTMTQRQRFLLWTMPYARRLVDPLAHLSNHSAQRWQRLLDDAEYGPTARLDGACLRAAMGAHLDGTTSAQPDRILTIELRGLDETLSYLRTLDRVLTEQDVRSAGQAAYLTMKEVPVL